MGAYILRRLLLAIPIMLGVALVCFMLVQIAPGDPLVSVLPPDASQELRAQMIAAYGFDQPLPVQFTKWLWHAVQGDLGTSIATSRPVFSEVMTAAINSLRLAFLATLIGFFFGCLFGFVAGYFQDTDYRTQQDGGRDKLLGTVIKLEVLGNLWKGTGDDACIIAVQPSGDGCNGSHHCHIGLGLDMALVFGANSVCHEVTCHMGGI